MSNIGKKDRQIWYDFHAKRPKEVLSAPTRIKFLFGDILERMLIFLAKEAGHEVTGIQATVSVDDIVGHQDAIIDGVLVDAKSCSSPSFVKFQTGDLKDDPFGYEAQLAGYSKANGDLDSAFLAIDKQHGDLALLPVSSAKLKEYDVSGRIAHIKQVVASDVVPDKCYEPKPYGKSGNMSLPIGCSYCAHKFECHADANGGKGLRAFLYSGKPVFFTEITREPKVPELFVRSN